MKVLFQGRYDLFNNRGGDTVQVENTASELRKLGIEVDFNPNCFMNLEKYDIVHVFQLDWVCETYLQVKNAKKCGKPVVLSPIHHSFAEVDEFEDEARYSLRKYINVLVKSQEHRDVLKNLYRSFSDTRKLYPTLLSIYEGYRNQQKKALEMSDMILTQTHSEAKDLKRDYGVDFKFKSIPLGVGGQFLTSNISKMFDYSDYLVTVGRIEPRKNQLKIIEAVELIRAEGLDVRLVVIGDRNKNNKEYFEKFLKLIDDKDWVTYIPKVDYQKMPSVYAGAKVCISASFFETTGLTLLEAAMLGCNVVARNGDTGARVREYLSDLPFNCDPRDVNSIKTAIKSAFKAERPQLSDYIRAAYSWQSVASATLGVYAALLNVE